MKGIEREIGKYRILASMQLRAGGSKHGEHWRRDLWDVCGKPLVQWSLEAAMGCKHIDKIAVCVGDKEIGDVVAKLGVQVIDRPLYTTLAYPRNYATGVFGNEVPRSLRSKIPDVFLDAHAYVRYWMREEKGFTPDLILRMMSNHVMVTTDIINRVVEAFFEDKEATMATTFYPGPDYLYLYNSKTKRLNPVLVNFPGDRQEFLPRWVAGPLKLRGISENAQTQGVKIAPVFITEEEGLDVHDEEDLFLANCYMKRRIEREKKGGEK